MTQSKALEHASLFVLCVGVLSGCSTKSGGPGAGADGGGGGDSAVPGDGGTSGGGGVSDHYTSGTRLKAKWLVTADGNRQFATWTDTSLGLDCAFTVAGDGALRCVPTPDPNSYASKVLQVVNDYYSDAACTQRLLVVGAPAQTCGPPMYIQWMDEILSTCTVPRTHLYALGANVGPPTSVYIHNPSGCLTDTTHGMVTAYVAGPEADPNGFVAGTYSMGPDQGGVAARYIQGNDGSRGFDRWVDGPTGAPCSYASTFDLHPWFLAADGMIRCVPRGDPSAGYFTDSTCVNPFFVGCQTAALGAFIRPDPAFCVNRQAVYALGPTLSADAGGPIYETALDGGCEGLGSSAAGLRAATMEIPATSFALGIEPAPKGPGRLLPANVVTPGGLPQRLGWLDAQYNELCTFSPFNPGGNPLNAPFALDAQIRCGPTTIADVQWFADSACSQQLLVLGNGLHCGDPAPPLVYSYSQIQPQGCDARGYQMHAYQVGAKVTQATVYQGSSGACQPMSSPPDLDFYMGTELPASSFEAATVVVQ